MRVFYFILGSSFMRGVDAWMYGCCIGVCLFAYLFVRLICLKPAVSDIQNSVSIGIGIGIGISGWWLAAGI